MARVAPERRNHGANYVYQIYGELDHIRELLDRHNIIGVWEEEPNGVYMMRCLDGANLHWASCRGTVWSDGKRDACRSLAVRVASVLHAMTNVPEPQRF